jgi:hypothetical protein
MRAALFGVSAGEFDVQLAEFGVSGSKFMV